MTIASFTSADPSTPAESSASTGSSAFAGPSALAGPSAPDRSSASAGFSTSAGFWPPVNVPTPAGLVPFPHAGLLVVQDITKPFFIRKLVTAFDNTTAQIYIQARIWIGGILSISLNKAWEYIKDFQWSSMTRDCRRHCSPVDSISCKNGLWTQGYD